VSGKRAERVLRVVVNFIFLNDSNLIVRVL